MTASLYTIGDKPEIFIVMCATKCEPLSAGRRPGCQLKEDGRSAPGLDHVACTVPDDLGRKEAANYGDEGA